MHRVNGTGNSPVPRTADPQSNVRILKICENN